MVGVDPRPLTLRALAIMAEAKQAAAWGHTASMMALLAELKRDRKRKLKPYTPDDFNPMARRLEDEGEERPVTVAEFGAMVGGKFKPKQEPEP